MLGAVVGDVVGSAFEGQNRTTTTLMKDYNFVLFSEKSRFTDDTVCTMAIAEGLLYREVYGGSFQVPLLRWCRRHPQVGYGGAFRKWFESSDPKPYDSFGNGSAMRVSPVGFAYQDLEELDKLLDTASASAAVTHGHPEGIKGAQATAAAIFLARHGKSKGAIKEYIESKFSYDLSTPLDQIRPTYGFDVTCQGSVPQAIRCFLESADFVSCIRLAVSLGGDSDTQGAIAGGIAHAFYKTIPEQMVVETLHRLPNSFVSLILKFHEKYNIPF